MGEMATDPTPGDCARSGQRLGEARVRMVGYRQDNRVYGWDKLRRRYSGAHARRDALPSDQGGYA